MPAVQVLQADGSYRDVAADYPLPVGGVSGGSSPVSQIGATNVLSSQVTASQSAATVAIARPTRKQVTFKNVDTSLTVFISEATVTALKGMQLLPGQSFSPSAAVLWQVIAPSGSPVVCVTDEYY